MKVCNPLFIVVLLLFLPFTSTAQGVVNSVLKITVTSSSGEETGSGIIVGRKGDELFIITANHVVEDQESISVSFKQQPWAPIPAQLFTNYSEEKDLAVLIINLPEGVINTHQFKLGNLNGLKKDDKLSSIGHPNDLEWIEDKRGVITEPNYQAFNIAFSAGVSSGYSGGPLLLRKKNRLIGMVLEASANQAIAVRIDHVIAELENWNIPYQYISPYKPPPPPISYALAALSAGTVAGGIYFNSETNSLYDIYDSVRDPSAPHYDLNDPKYTGNTRAETLSKAKNNRTRTIISFGIAGGASIASILINRAKTADEEDRLSFFIGDQKYSVAELELGIRFRF